MNSSIHSYESSVLIAKKNASGFIIFAIFPFIGLCVAVYYYSEIFNGRGKNQLISLLLIATLLLLTIYFGYQFFDRGTKLLINKKGIWTKKYGLVHWYSIEFYHFEKRIGKIVSYIFWIESTTIGNSLKLEITFLDKNYTEIQKAIDINSKGFVIRYSGMNEYVN